MVYINTGKFIPAVFNGYFGNGYMIGENRIYISSKYLINALKGTQTDSRITKNDFDNYRDMLINVLNVYCKDNSYDGYIFPAFPDTFDSSLDSATIRGIYNLSVIIILPYIPINIPPVNQLDIDPQLTPKIGNIQAQQTIVSNRFTDAIQNSNIANDSQNMILNAIQNPLIL